MPRNETETPEFEKMDLHNSVSDAKLQRKLKIALQLRPAVHRQLISIASCGARVIRQTGMPEAVYLASNGEDSKFYGVQTCKNPWVCPHCEPLVMAKYATKIACAIDAMKKWYGQTAIMLTLTVPHDHRVTCKQSLDLLIQTYLDFVIHGNRPNSNNRHDAFANFCQYFNSTKRVRVIEATYSTRNGWHPHIHMLMWVDSDKLSEVASWEPRLRERWHYLLPRVFAKLNSVSMLKDSPTIRGQIHKVKHRVKVEEIAEERNPIADLLKNAEQKHSLFISKDNEGRVRAQQSSQYICGWGADKELTGKPHRKTAAEHHYTPAQLLAKATPALDDIYMNAFLEYASAAMIRRRRRVMFTKGLGDIIRRWQRTNEFVETVKKKLTSSTACAFKVVCWFTKEQWCAISCLDQVRPIKIELLELARAPNARELISSHLLNYDIDISHNDMNAFFVAHINAVFRSWCEPDSDRAAV